MAFVLVFVVVIVIVISNITLISLTLPLVLVGDNATCQAVTGQGLGICIFLFLVFGLCHLIFDIVVVSVIVLMQFGAGWGQCDTSGSDRAGTRPLRTGDSQLGLFAAQVEQLYLQNINYIDKYLQIFAAQVEQGYFEKY